MRGGYIYLVKMYQLNFAFISRLVYNAAYNDTVK